MGEMLFFSGGVTAAIKRLYRKFFCCGGYGVHSPFVFDLITNVIEEQKPYYCYERLHSVRLQLLQLPDEVTCRRRKLTVKKAFAKYCFTATEDRLLFRLANCFRPKTIYAAGSDFGLTPLYLTAYSKDSECIVYEPEPHIAAIAHEFVKKYASASVVLCENPPKIPEKLDFMVWGHSFTFFSDRNKNTGETFTMQTFEQFLPHIHDESVMVIAGIHTSTENRKTWKSICIHPKVTVTIDLCRLGIVFFNPKFHRKTYQSVVL